MSASDPFVQAEAAAAEVARRAGGGRHEVAVVLGSGWGGAAAPLGEVRVEMPMAGLPGFPAPSVLGHAGVVRSLDAGGRRVLALLGRSHLYEGHDAATVVHGVRTAVAAGCDVVLLTNAAGGVREKLVPGQPVLIADHLNLTGKSPLVGPVFVDLTDTWSSRLRQLARAADPGLEEGVYAGLAGPQYETPAEIRMLRTLGADLVGMSTVLEAIAARHLGAEVLGLSLVTNVAAGLAPAKIDHAEVLATGQQSADHLAHLLRAVVDTL